MVSNNDEMAIGAVLAARKQGIKDEDVLIVGLDATPDALEYLGKGFCPYFTVYHIKGYDKSAVHFCSDFGV